MQWIVTTHLCISGEPTHRSAGIFIGRLNASPDHKLLKSDGAILLSVSYFLPALQVKTAKLNKKNKQTA